MTPGLRQVVEYQLAAERLHDTPFSVVTLMVGTHRGQTSLRVFENHVRRKYVGANYAEAHDKAVRAFMVFNRLDRIRGVID